MHKTERGKGVIRYQSIDGNIQRRRGCPMKKRSDNGNGVVKRTRLLVQEKPQKKREIAFCSMPEPITETKPAEKTILSWLMSRGVVLENERIQYVMKRELLMREGIARRDGVLCRCCEMVMNVWEFEIHAGSNLERPYENILVFRTNKSLLRHMIEIWDKNGDTESRKFNLVLPRIGATDNNDDACRICADGGELICCEKCPSTFHPSCMQMKNIPQGDWLCPYCVCKYCGGGYGEMLTCLQCDKKYHWKCFLDREDFDLNKTGLTLFCGSSCRKVNGKLQGLIGVKAKLKEGFSWTLLQRMDPFDIDDEHKRMECNSRIAVAWELLNECFKANTDRHSQINILQSVVYNRGSNLTRMNFRGFYTAILEKNDGIISAATIRIHGNELVEMPFIATRENYRSKGMSRMLFDVFHYVLTSIDVKHLPIPSLPQLVNMWQRKYNFYPIDDEMKQKLININTLMFPCTVRLQKTFQDASASSSSAAMDIDQNDENCIKFESQPS